MQQGRESGKLKDTSVNKQFTLKYNENGMSGATQEEEGSEARKCKKSQRRKDALRVTNIGNETTDSRSPGAAEHPNHRSYCETQPGC